MYKITNTTSVDVGDIIYRYIIPIKTLPYHRQEKTKIYLVTKAYMTHVETLRLYATTGGRLNQRIRILLRKTLITNNWYKLN